MMKDTQSAVGLKPLLDDRDLPKRGAEVQALFVRLDEEIESAREKAAEKHQAWRESEAVFNALIRVKHTLSAHLHKVQNEKGI